MTRSQQRYKPGKAVTILTLKHMRSFDESCGMVCTWSSHNILETWWNFSFGSIQETWF